MVGLTDEVQNLIEQERVIVVGSVDKNGITNVSPRSSIYWNNSYIYWLEFFDHKSRKNFKDNPWTSIAVFNVPKQHGYQLKGKVNFADKMTKKEIVYKITQSLSDAIKKIYDEKIKNEQLEVMQFEPRAIYSLDPRKETGRLLELKKDDETLSVLNET